ncbi:amino acid ABC transporter membrane protein 2, PAAT family [Frankia sp. EI5c]|uniref:amino acid ABC transporter permease n=1 Tax=Frankia sp. EI5c TaxID=683316 RepID=UPI0007C2FDD5|nr:amino acid ABC transporter permease [Frankia sp. EI5c]OAA24751.1 amino acid ABC transporter membrane protein 2, PAAT family [Frankia sp. EI5c]
MSLQMADPPGPRGRRRILIASLLAGAGLAALAVLAVLRLDDAGQLDPKLWRVLLDEPDLRTLLWEGLLDTLRAAATGMVLAIVLGTLLAFARLSKRPAVRAPAAAIVEILRGLPLLMLIFFAYLGLPALGLELSAFWALVLGLTAYNGAVLSEIFRAGVLSIDRGQTEAAEALGLRGTQIFLSIQFPQAVRRMAPTLVSQLVTLLKDTSLGYVIGYTELLRQGRSAVEVLGGRYALPLYTTLAVIYIIVNGSLSLTARWLERRQNVRAGRSPLPVDVGENPGPVPAVRI